ncbi:MAG: ABC transporter permease [Clostridiales bacterium]|nr:ABC transporter permease [Clostridiales bacterium]
MPVFNLCLKILKKNLPVMSIYFGVFIMVSFIMMSNASGAQTGYSDVKTSVAILTSEESELIDGLKESLSDVAVFVDLEDDRDRIQDALYFRSVGYIIRVPDGFTEEFLAGGTPTLSKTVVPGSNSSIYIDMNIEQYLNTARLYANAMPEMPLDELTDAVLVNLSQDTKVSMLSSERIYGEQGMMQYYFNYLAYTFMFVLILGISVIMLVFNDLNIKRRNACSPISAAKINFQFYLANMLFTFVSWIILVSVSLAFGHKELSSPNTWYFIVNSLLFALTASGIGFFIGNLVKGREAISAVANIFTLGTCFISGVFVPQVLLGEGVLRLASFFPTYWYVKANAQIAGISNLSWSNLNGVGNTFLVQLGFAAAFFVLAMVVGKRKQMAVEEE